MRDGLKPFPRSGVACAIGSFPVAPSSAAVVGTYTVLVFRSVRPVTAAPSRATRPPSTAAASATAAIVGPRRTGRTVATGAPSDSLSILTTYSTAGEEVPDAAGSQNVNTVRPGSEESSISP